MAPELNRALRLLRVFHDKRASQFAGELGVSPGFLSQIENGGKSPNLDLIAKYAQVLETTSARILRFSEDLQSSRVPNGSRSEMRIPLIKMMEALGYKNS